jgi:hypothetical protein
MSRSGARAGARDGVGVEEGWGRVGRSVVVVLEEEEKEEANAWVEPVLLLMVMLKAWACVLLLVVLTATERPKLAGGAPLPLPPR